MLQDCLEQVSVTGEQCQIESPEPFQRFLEPRTLPLEESFPSDIDIPTADQTTREEVGIQCELLVSKNVPMVKSVSIQAGIPSRPTFVTVATQTDIQNHPTLESVHTQTTATDVSMPITSEIVSPQKSIFSELTCTSTDIDSADDDDDMYMPVSAESQTESDNESDNDPVKSAVEQQKFIVFEENLDKLFLMCSTCSKPTAEVSKTLVGSMVVVHSLCVDGHQNRWQSQPMIDSKVAGNVLLAGSILFSGNSFQNVNSLAQRLNLAFIGKSVFYNIQKDILIPVVDKAWKDHQDSLLNEVKKLPKLDVCGDGRCDSPGHCAKYGTYTVMDENTNKILDFEVIQVTEVSSSNAMEAEGCNRVLKNLKKKGVKVRCLTTDRHTTITAEMRKKHPEIVTQYDVWHLSKWIVKKLSKKSKKKQFQELSIWIQSVSAHFWWSIATCDGNYDILIEKWTSIVNHVSNKHSWRGAKHFKKCVHHKLSRREIKEKVWLKTGTAAHVALEEVVYNKKLLKDLKLVTEFHHTGSLEVYHSMMLKYCPKRQHFGNEGMIARTQLAALDNNHNCSRKKAVVKHGSSQGSLRYNLVFPKVRKTWVVKPIMEEKVYKYLDVLMENILAFKRLVLKKKSKKIKKSKNIATKEKPDKETAIKTHISRFQPK